MSIISFCPACCGSIDANDDYLCTCGNCPEKCHGNSFLHRSCLGPSQLTTQWAVFLAQIGYGWQYGTHTYECSYRLTLESGIFPFRPDFWLADDHLFGVARDVLGHSDLTQLLNAAAHLSSGGGSGCHDSGGHDLVVFGKIPVPNWDEQERYCWWRLPTLLHMHKGDLQASGWYPGSQNEENGKTIATDYGGDPGIYSSADISASTSQSTPERVAQWLTRGSWEDAWVNPAENLDGFLHASTMARGVFATTQSTPLPVAAALPASASPIERQFWEAHCRLALPELSGLTFQHHVLRYRLDFALPAHKIGIELDGFRNHSSTADLARDHQRQRRIETEGWRVFRFGGAEVHHNPERCVRDTAQWIRSLGAGQ